VANFSADQICEWKLILKSSIRPEAISAIMSVFECIQKGQPFVIAGHECTITEYSYSKNIGITADEKVRFIITGRDDTGVKHEQLFRYTDLKELCSHQ